MTETEAVAALDEAIEAYERFQEAMRELDRFIYRIDPFLHSRVEAYPGWYGTRDMGGGQDMMEWLEEIGRRLGVGGEAIE